MTPNGHQVKTTVGMQMTTVVRTNAPSRVHNGPLTSGLVKKVVNSDERFADSLALVDEPMGIYLKHDGIDNDSYKRAYHLNALFKNNPTAREGEIMMPVATLYANSPFTGRAVIADMLAASGRDNPDAALAYFTDYARMVVHNDVGMFARYGISLEGHQQNTLVAFDKSGTPSRSIYRDFSGGVEVYEPILASQKSFDDAKLDMRPHLHEVTSVLDDSMEAPLNQVVHTTIRLHLLPMVDIFEKEFGMDRDAAMETLRNTVKAEITAARNEHTPKIKEEKRDDYEAFLDHVEQEICETPFSQKSMLLARLQGTQSVKFGAPVDNPLSR